METAKKIALSEQVIALLNDERSAQTLATVGKDGTPHSVFADAICADADGTIRYWELLETSITNKNLTYALWFRRTVAITVRGADGMSWQITGIPIKALICGAEFEDAYRAARERFGDGADLSTVWLITPVAAREETYAIRRQAEQTQHPLIGHLDRLARPSLP